MPITNLVNDRGEPDVTNDQGTKFWLYQPLSDYCKSRGLMKHYVLLCEDSKGFSEYVLMDGHDPIYSNQSFEAICCHIDAIWASENMDKLNELNESRLGGT